MPLSSGSAIDVPAYRVLLAVPCSLAHGWDEESVDLLTVLTMLIQKDSLVVIRYEIVLKREALLTMRAYVMVKETISRFDCERAFNRFQGTASKFSARFCFSV